ncbi:DUF302 domain-containing protein [Klebsiella aerogenes]|uniref:DUF302 domain-containing protein n=1 Tax=Klebsiella aerogenes TaxID=548 RepID=UPI001F3266EE|nr:DUF302 domain-containing protein [Klebsiella aerogenes]
MYSSHNEKPFREFKSPHSVKTTLDRLELLLARRPGIVRFFRIDQQATAAISGKKINPVESMFFQNNQINGLLLSRNIRLAESLPVKAMCYEDDDGHVWLQITNPLYLDSEYKLDGADGLIHTIDTLIVSWARDIATDDKL